MNLHCAYALYRILQNGEGEYDWFLQRVIFNILADIN